MENKAVLIAMLAVMALAISGCTQPQPQPANGSAYFEIVREGKSLGDLGSTEYLMTSAGLILRKIKVEFSGREPLPTQIAIFRVTEGDAKALLGEVKANAATLKEECNGCSTYHMFYYDADGTKAYEVSEGNASSFVKALPARMEALIKNAKREETFFMSLVYSEGDKIPDYHIFEDGAVIYEEFSLSKDTLLNARMLKLDPEKIKNAIPDDFFAWKGAASCNRREFGYGYVEAADKEKYNFAYTCGMGDSAADKFFDKLYGIVGGK